jgi:hypothetical protein
VVVRAHLGCTVGRALQLVLVLEHVIGHRLAVVRACTRR